MLTLKHEQALAEAQRAIDLNPNFALGYFALGWIRSLSWGVPPMRSTRSCGANGSTQTIRKSDTYLGQTALAYYHLKNYEEAVRRARSAASGSAAIHSPCVRSIASSRAARPHRGRAHRQPRARLAQRGRRPLLGGHDRPTPTRRCALNSMRDCARRECKPDRRVGDSPCFRAMPVPPLSRQPAGRPPRRKRGGKSGLHGKTVPGNARRGRPQGKCHRKQTASPSQLRLLSRAKSEQGLPCAESRRAEARQG